MVSGGEGSPLLSVTRVGFSGLALESLLVKAEGGGCRPMYPEPGQRSSRIVTTEMTPPHSQVERGRGSQSCAREEGFRMGSLVTESLGTLSSGVTQCGAWRGKKEEGRGLRD